MNNFFEIKLRKEIRLKRLLVFLIAVMIIFSQGCNEDDIINPPVIVNSSKGVYVLSEGGFSSGTSKLSFYNNSNDSFYANIFNPGSLGLAPDGMIIENNNIYLCEQGNFGSAGKVYLTDTNGTVISSGDAGTNPYSLAIANNKIYLTNGPANNVTVLDKNSLAVITTVNVGLYPQEILAVGNKVFVCNTSLFTGETDSTVSVIDATTDIVTATIEVRYAPSSIKLSADGKVLVGCPGDSTIAAIFKIDPDTYNKLDSFTNLRYGFCNELTVLNTDQIYYIGGATYSQEDIVIYTFSLRSSAVFIPRPASPALFYGLAYDTEAGVLYAGYVPSFSTNGQLRIYNSGGVLQRDYIITNGIGPRRLVVKR